MEVFSTLRVATNSNKIQLKTRQNTQPLDQVPSFCQSHGRLFAIRVLTQKCTYRMTRVSRPQCHSNQFQLGSIGMTVMNPVLHFPILVGRHGGCERREHCRVCLTLSAGPVQMSSNSCPLDVCSTLEQYLCDVHGSRSLTSSRQSRGNSVGFTSSRGASSLCCATAFRPKGCVDPKVIRRHTGIHPQQFRNFGRGRSSDQKRSKSMRASWETTPVGGASGRPSAQCFSEGRFS